MNIVVIPAELRARPQWVIWQAETRENDKPTKMPYQAKYPSRKAEVNDPSTWTAFARAVAACNRLKTMDGVGYVFAEDDPYVGVDLDKCLRADGEVEEWARPYVERLGRTYGEVSPSGRGIKFFARGRLDGTGKRRTGYGPDGIGAIEIYDRRRFFTITGNVWDADVSGIADLSDVLVELYEEVKSRPRREPEPPRQNRPRKPRPTNERWSPEARCVAYLEKCDPAVSGQGGHDRTFSVACHAGPGFDLPPDVFRRLMSEVYNPRCEPPWTDWELEHKIQDAYRLEARRGWLLETDRNGDRRENGTVSSKAPNNGTPGPAEHPVSFPMTDLGNAERLVARHGADLRFCHPWGKWLVWDGRRWQEDETALVRRHAKETARSIFGEAAAETDDERRKALAKWSLTSEKRDRIGSMIHLAEAENGIPILPAMMDADPWLLNAQNGTIDLRTGELRPHRREDFITKVCPTEYHPGAKCPLWLATLERVFRRGDVDVQAALIRYWRRLCGYALTGVVQDHILPIAFGTGSNGKSTVLGALADVLGPDYAMKARAEMFMARKFDSHPTDLADLFGKRLILAIETEGGRRLNETLVKELTGGDRIRARRMREDFWEFSPTHTILMATNHRPNVRGTDHAIWRRLRLVPFNATIAESEADKAMPKKLRGELPGILAWCVRGCLEWQAEGLEAPEEVNEATGEYRREQDVLGAFLEECTIENPAVRSKASDLYGRYKQWSTDGNEHAASQTTFGRAMVERGFEKTTSNGTWYLGVALRSD